jgi:hypothetical protein
VIDFPEIIFTIPPEIVFSYYAVLLGFLIPGSMITIFYVLVLIRLHQIRQKHRSELKQRSHRKVTRIVLAVITVYFICWVPYWFLQVFITIDPLIHSLGGRSSILSANTNMRFLKELTHLTTVIGYANNCLNPLLYVFLSDLFREEYLLVLQCFHGAGVVVSHNDHQPYETVRPREHDKSHVRVKSMKSRQCREQAVPKEKHSIAIDDVPTELRKSSSSTQPVSLEHEPQRKPRTYRSVSTIRRANEHGRQPASSSLRIFSSKQRQASSTSAVIHTSLVGPMHRSAKLTDDGGVYCGL